MTDSQNIKRVPLTQGKFAIVDAEDYEMLSRHKWYAHKAWGDNYYAMRNILLPSGKRTAVYMHRVILGVDRGIYVDHGNSDGLDNRRKNLRSCTNAQNAFGIRKMKGTSSKYKGVCWNSQCEKWQSYIRYNYNYQYLGVFDSETEAALTYNRFAIRYFGAFARLNEIAI